MTRSLPSSHAQKALLAERINKLAIALADGVYERESTIKLCLLAALTGESVFLLGPPGIAKSFIAKRLIQAFDDSRYFEYLMTRFSTPEEVFGPLSIQELKDNGRYVRLTEGYLPTAQVVFLDEIWKAGPAILNTLLTVVNEKTFKNGTELERVPMRLLISASNELPDEDSGLDALYDRMLVRIFVNRIQNKQNFKSMLTIGSPQEAEIPAGLAITEQEYRQWQRELELLPLSDTLFDKLYLYKSRLEQAGQESGLPMDDIYVSDRRWKKAVKLLKASAFFNGRDQLSPLDLLLLRDCLWNTPQSRELVYQVTDSFAVTEAFDQALVGQNIERCHQEFTRIQIAIEQALSISPSEEPASRLRKKPIHALDLSQVKYHKVGHVSHLIKLVLLQANQSVAEAEKGDSRWIYLTKEELQKAVKQGQGEFYGYVNHNPNVFRLRIEINADNKLVIKDIANRSVLLALVTQQGLDQEQYQAWLASAEQAMTELQHTEHHLRQVRSDFQKAIPHNFIDSELLIEIQSGLHDLHQQLEDTQQEFAKKLLRLKLFNEYFD